MTSPARFAGIDLGLETISEPCDTGHRVLFYFLLYLSVNIKGDKIMSDIQAAIVLTVAQNAGNGSGWIYETASPSIFAAAVVCAFVFGIIVIADIIS